MKLIPLLLFFLSTSLPAQNVTVTVFDDIMVTLPDSTRIGGVDRKVNWKSIRALSALVKDTSSLRLTPVKGVEMEIWARASHDYVTGVNKLTRMQWLTFITQMSGMQAKDVQRKSDRSFSSLTGEYVAGHYRAILGRSAWYEGNAFHNTLILDVFHNETLVSFLFTWTAPEGSEEERVVDMIVTSVVGAR